MARGIIKIIYILLYSYYYYCNMLLLLLLVLAFSATVEACYYYDKLKFGGGAKYFWLAGSLNPMSLEYRYPSG